MVTNQSTEPLSSNTTSNDSTQDASSSLGSSIANIMENLGTLSLVADHTILSKSEVGNCIRNMVDKISASINKLDTLSGIVKNMRCNREYGYHIIEYIYKLSLHRIVTT